jgi:hypothetical protein
MTAEQLSKLWAFARGDIAEISFEKWFLAQSDLEAPLGEELHFDVMSGSLIWSAEDLRKARPEITVDEVARLLGVTPKKGAGERRPENVR